MGRLVKGELLVVWTYLLRGLWKSDAWGFALVSQRDYAKAILHLCQD